MIDRPDLDWYARRQFASKTHYLLFLPMFYWEQKHDSSNPGYHLLPTFRTAKKQKMKTEPNKAMQPTPVAVTPCAVARAAPSTSVADL
jgi:hypothetical protein